MTLSDVCNLRFEFDVMDKTDENIFIERGSTCFMLHGTVVNRYTYTRALC